MRPKAATCSNDDEVEDSAPSVISSLTFGGNQMQDCIRKRRIQDWQAPPDVHEEITRYLKDPLVEPIDCASVLDWWKVQI